jgi:hypothetical protein
MKRLILITSLLIACCVNVNAQKSGFNKGQGKPQKETSPATTVTESENAPTNGGGSVKGNTTPKSNPGGSVKGQTSPSENGSTTIPKGNPKGTPKGETNTLPTELPKPEPIVEEFDNGQIDWSSQFVEATGVCIIDKQKFPNERQAIEMAKRGAAVIAKANLLEIVQGVRIIRETTVKDMMAESDIVQTRLDGVLKGARTVGEPRIADGAVEVTVRVPIYERNGIAPIIQQELNKKSGGEPSGGTEKVNLSTDEAQALTDSLSKYILNFKDGNFLPTMFPTIKGDGVSLDLSKLYDPIKGKFPPYLKLTEQMFKDLQFKQGTKIIDAIQDFDGTIKVDTKKQPNAGKWLQWLKMIGTTAAPFVLSLFTH